MKRITVSLAGIAAALLAMTSASAADSYADDRAQIRDLMGRYLFAMDWHDADTYASTFTEDGTLEWARATQKGRKEIHDTMTKAWDQEAKEAAGHPQKRPMRRRHNVTNTVLKIAGNKAISRSYWTEYFDDNDQRSAEVAAYGHYEDELVKKNGQWLFTRRVIFNEEMAARAAPGKNPAW